MLVLSSCSFIILTYIPKGGKLVKKISREVRIVGRVFKRKKVKYIGTFMLPFIGAILSVFLIASDYIKQRKKVFKA